MISKPWLLASADIPKIVDEPKGMIGPEERRAYYWLGRERLSGEGCIVDAGAFLGASTFCFAAGAAAGGRRDIEGRTLIHAYDYFMAVDDYVAAAITRDFRPTKKGDSYLDIFHKQTSQYSDVIRAHPGDFLTHRWCGDPIDILFVDVAKTAALNSHVFHEFFPSLIPGRSIVLQQDYYHCWHPYIHIGMEFFSEEFELIDEWVQHQTRIWRLTKPLPPEKLARMKRYDLTKEERLSLLDRLIGKSSEQMRPMMEVVKLWQQVIDRDLDAAAEQVARLRRDLDIDSRRELWARQAREVETHIEKRLHARRASATPVTGRAPEEAANEIIIVASARSGSNQLVEYLNQAKGVNCYGEIFKMAFPDELGWTAISKLFASDGEARSLQRNNVLKYWTTIAKFDQQTGRIPGAKIFYQHRAGDPIWDRILSGKAHVIHLYRDAILDSYASLARAQQTGVWSVRRGENQAEQAAIIHFDLNDYQTYRDQLRKGFTRVHDALNDSPKYIEIEYNEIAAPQQLGEKLSAFLGLKVTPVATLEKQFAQPAWAIFGNEAEARNLASDRLSSTISEGS